MFTLLLGQLAVFGLQSRRYGSQYWAPLLALAAALTFKVDYGYKGVLLIMLLYLAKDSRTGLIAVMTAYCLFWGEGTTVITSLFGINFTGLQNVTDYSASLYRPVFRLQNLAVLSLIFIAHPNIGWNRRHPAWLSYIAYPGHLLILWIIRDLIL